MRGREDRLCSRGSREVSGEGTSTPTPARWAGASEAEGGMSPSVWAGPTPTWLTQGPRLPTPEAGWGPQRQVLA